MLQERPIDPFSVSVHEAAKDHAESMAPNHSVGVVRDGVYFLCTNNTYATNIEARINPAELEQHQSLGNVQAVVYSHPRGNNAPTLTERREREAYDIIWGVTPVESGVAQGTVWWGDGIVRSPLLDRAFILGVWDCYDLFRDWWIINHNIYPPQVVHDMESTVGGQGIFLDNYIEGGLSNLGKIPIEEMLPGDMVLLSTGHGAPNQCGVYISDGEIIYYGGEHSRQEKLINLWRLYAGVLRHQI